MAKRIMIVRHAKKGDGITRLKNQLSGQGEKDARLLGEYLPKSMKGAPITHVGGSIHSRTTHTALLIALGHGDDPKVIASQEGLGSEKWFFELIGTDASGFKAALEKHNSCEIDAVRELCTSEAYKLLKSRALMAISHADNQEYSEGNIVLGTHSPWLQIIFEALNGGIYHGNAKELDYIVVEVVNDEIKIVDTTLLT